MADHGTIRGSRVGVENVISGALGCEGEGMVVSTENPAEKRGSCFSFPADGQHSQAPVPYQRSDQKSSLILPARWFRLILPILI